MKTFFKDFQDFAMRGNVIDLAVGVVIGAAFNQVTTSLVTNIITPPIGLLIGGFDFSKLALSLGGSAEIGYGAFLQAILNFIIIAFALFILIKFINRLMMKRKEEERQPAENPELKVLMEIRDSLVKQNS